MKKLIAIPVTLFLLVLWNQPVAFGQAAPPSITITSPTAGATVDVASITVTGNAAGLPENNLVVQAQDANGAVLGQTPATVETDAPGGAGPWSAQLELNVASDTPGRIYAFSQSPADGSLLAEVAVQVTFGEAAPPVEELPTETPTLEAAQPTAEPPTAEPPTAEPPTAEPPTQEPPTAVPPTQEPPTPEPPAQAALSINIPLSGEQVSPVEIVVVGTGSALPENNVVVQARGPDGGVLDQQVATVDAPLGGSGEWRATLAPNAAPGTAGVIYAYAQSPADGSILAEASIPVVYGAAEPTIEPTATETPTAEPTPTATAEAGSPAISIRIPLNGEQVSAAEVVVVGNGSGLPENNVVVQARAADGTILDSKAAVVDAPLGGSGEWRAALQPNTQAGVTGSIYAYAQSPADGSILAEASVAVSFGAALPTPTPTPTPGLSPDVRINRPRPSELVDPAQFEVSGIGIVLPENNVIVRAVGANGVVLAEVATTVDAPLGGAGAWRTTIQPNAEPGTTGAIIAYAIDARTGNVLVDDRIRVVYGVAPAPVLPEVTIAEPLNGARVDARGVFNVAGASQGLFEGNVIVQIQDLSRNVLFQTVTTANAEGAWSAPISILAADGAPGRIYAYSTSPIDGAIIADDLVQVSFASNCTPRLDWPVYVVQPGDTLFGVAQQTGSTVGDLVLGNCLTNPNVILVGQQLRVPRPPQPGIVTGPPTVAIESPTSGESLNLAQPVLVTGSSEWTVAGGLFARALDNNGVVLDEARVEATSPVQNGAWDWQVELDLSRVPPGARGAIFVYAPSLIDGSISAAANVDVVYGDDDGQPFITILAPEPYAQAPAGSVNISGRGRGLFEGNVVVSIRDAFGRELAVQPTTLDAQEVGGEGGWSVTMPLDYAGRGRVIAYNIDMANGSTVAQATRELFLGDPASLPNYTMITYPLPDTVIRGGDDLRAIAGYVRGVFGNSVYLSVLDAENRLRFILPVPVNSQNGFWSISPTADLSLTRDGEITLFATATSPTSGQILANDSIRLRIERPTIRGQIVYPEGSTLPPDAVVTVQVVNQMLADAPPEMTVLGEQVITAPGQPPTDFAVSYNPADVDERVLYGVTATIRDGAGNLLFINTEPVLVLTQDNPTKEVEVVVQAP